MPNRDSSRGEPDLGPGPCPSRSPRNHAVPWPVPRQFGQQWPRGPFGLSPADRRCAWTTLRPVPTSEPPWRGRRHRGGRGARFEPMERGHLKAVWRAKALGPGLKLLPNRWSLPDYSSASPWVTRSTSSIVVRPSQHLAQPSWRRVVIPAAMARCRSSCPDAFRSVSERSSSVIGKNS